MTNEDIAIEADIRAAGLTAMRKWIDGNNNRLAVIGERPVIISDGEVHQLLKAYLSGSSLRRVQIDRDAGRDSDELTRALALTTPTGAPK